MVHVASARRRYYCLEQLISSIASFLDMGGEPSGLPWEMPEPDRDGGGQERIFTPSSRGVNRHRTVCSLDITWIDHMLHGVDVI